MKKFSIIMALALAGFLFLALKLDSGINFQNRNLACLISPVKYFHDAKEFNMKPGSKLNVHLQTGGNIEVESWNENKVSVEIDKMDVNKAALSFKQSDDELEISNDIGWEKDGFDSDATLKIKVPSKFDLELYTSGGEISIKGVEGAIDGQTMGGDLTLSGLKGKVKLNTMGGEISLKDSEVDGSVKTMGGEVLVENVKGDVDASSMGGQVRQVNVEGRGKSIGKEVNITTMGGDLIIDKAPSGAYLKTMGGKIEVNQAGKFLEAETYGGAIEAKAVDGWITAKTMGGDIDVKMTGDPNEGKRDVTLQSLGGDITLVVPANLSMDIDVEIAYVKNRKHKSDEEFNKYKIVSDFPVNQERSKEWDTSKGSPRKYIYAKGTVEGGKNKIKIRTINGNVYLKKA